MERWTTKHQCTHVGRWNSQPKLKLPYANNFKPSSSRVHPCQQTMNRKLLNQRLLRQQEVCQPTFSKEFLITRLQLRHNLSQPPKPHFKPCLFQYSLSNPHLLSPKLVVACSLAKSLLQHRQPLSEAASHLLESKTTAKSNHSMLRKST